MVEIPYLCDATLRLDARGYYIKKHHHPHKRAIVDGNITIREATTLETFRDETLSFPQPHYLLTLDQTSFATPSRLFLPE